MTRSKASNNRRHIDKEQTIAVNKKSSSEKDKKKGNEKQKAKKWEAARRNRFNKCLNDLRDELPSCQTKVRGKIVEEAIHFIRKTRAVGGLESYANCDALKKEIALQQETISSLKMKNAVLVKLVNDLGIQFQCVSEKQPSKMYIVTMKNLCTCDKDHSKTSKTVMPLVEEKTMQYVQSLSTSETREKIEPIVATKNCDSGSIEVDASQTYFIEQRISDEHSDRKSLDCLNHGSKLSDGLNEPITLSQRSEPVRIVSGDTSNKGTVTVVLYDESAGTSCLNGEPSVVQVEGKVHVPENSSQIYQELNAVQMEEQPHNSKNDNSRFKNGPVQSIFGSEQYSSIKGIKSINPIIFFSVPLSSEIKPPPRRLQPIAPKYNMQKTLVSNRLNAIAPKPVNSEIEVNSTVLLQSKKCTLKLGDDKSEPKKITEGRVTRSRHLLPQQKHLVASLKTADDSVLLSDDGLQELSTATLTNLIRSVNYIGIDMKPMENVNIADELPDLMEEVFPESDQPSEEVLEEVLISFEPNESHSSSYSQSKRKYNSGGVRALEDDDALPCEESCKKMKTIQEEGVRNGNGTISKPSCVSSEESIIFSTCTSTLSSLPSGSLEQNFLLLKDTRHEQTNFASTDLPISSSFADCTAVNRSTISLTEVSGISVDTLANVNAKTEKNSSDSSHPSDKQCSPTFTSVKSTTSTTPALKFPVSSHQEKKQNQHADIEKSDARSLEPDMPIEDVADSIIASSFGVSLLAADGKKVFDISNVLPDSCDVHRSTVLHSEQESDVVVEKVKVSHNNSTVLNLINCSSTDATSIQSLSNICTSTTTSLGHIPIPSEMTLSFPAFGLNPPDLNSIIPLTGNDKLESPKDLFPSIFLSDSTGFCFGSHDSSLSHLILPNASIYLPSLPMQISRLPLAPHVSSSLMHLPVSSVIPNSTLSQPSITSSPSVATSFSLPHSVQSTPHASLPNSVSSLLLPTTYMPMIGSNTMLNSSSKDKTQYMSMASNLKSFISSPSAVNVLSQTVLPASFTSFLSPSTSFSFTLHPPARTTASNDQLSSTEPVITSSSTIECSTAFSVASLSSVTDLPPTTATTSVSSHSSNPVSCVSLHAVSSMVSSSVSKLVSSDATISSDASDRDNFSLQAEEPCNLAVSDIHRNSLLHEDSLGNIARSNPLALPSHSFESKEVRADPVVLDEVSHCEIIPKDITSHIDKMVQQDIIYSPEHCPIVTEHDCTSLTNFTSVSDCSKIERPNVCDTHTASDEHSLDKHKSYVDKYAVNNLNMTTNANADFVSESEYLLLNKHQQGDFSLQNIEIQTNRNDSQIKNVPVSHSASIICSEPNKPISVENDHSAQDTVSKASNDCPEHSQVRSAESNNHKSIPTETSNCTNSLSLHTESFCELYRATNDPNLAVQSSVSNMVANESGNFKSTEPVHCSTSSYHCSHLDSKQTSVPSKITQSLNTVVSINGNNSFENKISALNTNVSCVGHEPQPSSEFSCHIAKMDHKTSQFRNEQSISRNVVTQSMVYGNKTDTIDDSIKSGKKQVPCLNSESQNGTVVAHADNWPNVSTARSQQALDVGSCAHSSQSSLLTREQSNLHNLLRSRSLTQPDSHPIDGTQQIQQQQNWLKYQGTSQQKTNQILNLSNQQQNLHNVGQSSSGSCLHPSMQSASRQLISGHQQSHNLPVGHHQQPAQPSNHILPHPSIFPDGNMQLSDVSGIGKDPPLVNMPIHHQSNMPVQNPSHMIGSAGYVHSPPFDYSSYYRRAPQSPRSDARYQCYNQMRHQHGDMVPVDHPIMPDPHILNTPSINMPGQFMETTTDMVPARLECAADNVRYFSVSHLVSHNSDSQKLASGVAKEATAESEERQKDPPKSKGNGRKSEKPRTTSAAKTANHEPRRRSPARSGQPGSVTAVWGKSSVGQKQGSNYSTEAILGNQNYGRGVHRMTSQNYPIMPPNQMYPTQMYSSQPMKNSCFGYAPDRTGVPGHTPCNSDYNFQLHGQPSGSFMYGSNVTYMPSSYPYQNLPASSTTMIPGEIMAPSHPGSSYPRFPDFTADQSNFVPNTTFPLQLEPQDMCASGTYIGSGSSMSGRPPQSEFSLVNTSTGLSPPTHPRLQLSRAASGSMGSASIMGPSGGGAKRPKYGDGSSNMLDVGPLPHLSLHSSTPPFDDAAAFASLFPGSMPRPQSNFFLGSDNFIPVTNAQFPSTNMGTPVQMATPSGNRSSVMPFSPLRMMDRHQTNMGPSTGPHLSSTLSNFNLTSIIPEIDGKQSGDTGMNMTSRHVTSDLPGQSRLAMSTTLPQSDSNKPSEATCPVSFAHTSHQMNLGLNSSLASTFSSGINFQQTNH